MDPEKYVESGVAMAQNYEDPFRKKDGHLFNSIICNRNKSSCFFKIERVFYENVSNIGDFKRTPVCSSMFRSYCEVDIIEILNIQKILERRGKLDKIDFQTMVSYFESHTIFSIFHD